MKMSSSDDDGVTQPLTASSDHVVNYHAIRSKALSPPRPPRTTSDETLSRRRIHSDAGSEEEYVSIELPSFGNIGDNNTLATALHKCKKQVLQPYMLLLKLLGWSPWMTDEAVPHCGETCIWFTNALYPIFIISLIFLGYILQFASCISRSRTFYSLASDTKIVPNCTLDRHKDIDICTNPFASYVWTDVIHFLSYAYAFYVFRWCRNEELETVMTKTFLQTTSDRQRGYLSQGTLTLKVRVILLLGIIWLTLQVLTNILVILARILDCRVTASGRVGFSSWISGRYEDELSLPEMYVLIILMLIGFLAMDMVYVAVAVNYCAQCELLIFLIRGLNERIEEKSIPLQQAIRDYHSAGNYIDALGRQLAIAMSLVELVFITQAVVAFASLYHVKKNTTDETTERIFFAAGVLYVLLWSSMSLIAFFQASRLNNACNATVKVSLDVRLFGYQDASQSEIDSFIVYMTSHGRQRAARLFRVPIYSGYLWAVVSLSFMAVLVLTELDVLSFTIHL